MIPVPSDAIRLFEEGLSSAEVYSRNVINANGVPAGKRTVRRWRQAWLSGDAEEYESPHIERTSKSPRIVEEATTLTVSSNSEEIRSVEELIAAANIDLKEWRLERQKIRHYQAQRSLVQRNLQFDNGKISGDLYDDGGFSIANLVSVEAVFVRREEYSFEEALKGILDDLPAEKRPVREYKSSGGSYLLVVEMADPHFGKQSFDGLQTLETMEEEFLRSCEALVERALRFGYTVDRILFILGNDIFHIDGWGKTTTKGTPQDTTNPATDLISVVTRTYVQAIDLLAELGPVDVMYVPSNHDRIMGLWLANFLDAWFRDDNMVTVDVGSNPYKYYRYGRTLFGMTHGDGCKLEKLPGLMSASPECLPHWAETRYRVWLTGHLHTNRGMVFMLDEVMGVQLRISPPLCRTDFWHLLHAYHGNHRAVTGFWYHKENGPVGEFPVLVEEL